MEPGPWREVPYDEVAASEVMAAVAALTVTLDAILDRRARRLLAARETWAGRHRATFDSADGDLLVAADLLRAHLEDTRRRLTRELADVRSENRRRAAARAAWEADHHRERRVS